MLFKRKKSQESPTPRFDPNADPFAVPSLPDFHPTEKAQKILAEPPRVLHAIQTEADKRGLTPSQFLEQELGRVLSSQYPTNECLDEDELAVVVTGVDLPEDRMGH